MNLNQKIYSVSKASELLGISRQDIYYYINRGEIKPQFEMAGRRRKYIRLSARDLMLMKPSWKPNDNELEGEQA